MFRTLVVGKRTWSELAKPKRSDFVTRLMMFLRDALPEHFLGVPDSLMRPDVEKYTAEAMEFGLDTEEQTANYVQMRFEGGSDFSKALASEPDFRQALANRRVLSANKIEMIRDRFFTLS